MTLIEMRVKDFKCKFKFYLKEEFFTMNKTELIAAVAEEAKTETTPAEAKKEEEKKAE